MKPEDPQADPPEEELAQALADWDQELSGSGETLAADDRKISSEITPRLARDMDCVRLLRAVWNPGDSVGEGTRLPQDETQRIGRFEIRRELGCGGYGVVFLAYDPQLRREVALKVPRGEAMLTPDLRARFQHEARAAAALDHPHIVPVYDAGEVGPICYIASAYCPGETLAQWLGKQTKPVPFDDAARLVAALADAVAHAHSRGILHRDLKPANVLLAGVGDQGSGVRGEKNSEVDEANGAPNLDPKITDFGLARVLSDGDANLTRTGAVLGTPQYMAPEQATGRTQDISTAADIYALGAILYEMIAGQPPFRAETPLATLRKVEFDEPPPLGRARPKLPRDLETIVLKCLRKEPHLRYATAQGLADDLRRFLDGAPVEARPVGKLERCQRWCRRNPSIAGLAAAVLLLAVGGLIGAGRYVIDVTAARDDAQRNADDSRRSLVALSTANGDRLMREGDHFGSLLWYAQAWRLDDDPGAPGRQSLHRERFSAVLRQSPRLVHVWQHDKELSWVEYSPDGRYVVTAAYDGTARLFDADTGATVHVFRHEGGIDRRVERAYFSPDGRRVVTACHDGTARIFDVATGAELFKLQHDNPVHDARFSPDATLVATCGKGKIALVWDAASGRKLVELKHKAGVRCVCFSPDGQKVATGSKDKTARVWSVPSGKELMATWEHPEPVVSVMFSSDGKILLTGCGEYVVQRRVIGEVRMWHAEKGHRVHAKMRHADAIWMAAFSPDSRYIVSASRDKTARIWDANNSGALAILKHSDHLAGASFSRDGRRLVTVSFDDTAQIWDVPTGAPLSPFLRHAGDVYCAAFSPDGRRVATGSDDGTVRIWELAEVETPALALKHEKVTRAAALDPDGSRIVTASDDHTAKVWSLTNGTIAFSLDGHRDAVRDACYSADGRWIGTASMDRQARLWDAKSGKLNRTLPHDAPVVGISLDVAGSRMLALCGDGSVLVWNLRDDNAAPTALRHGGQINRAILSPDGRLAATAGADGKVRIWKADTGAEVGRPLNHPCAVVDIDFSRDGRLLVAAAGDGMLWEPRHAQVWNVATSEPVGAPLQHTDGVMSARFSPDGRFVATVSEDWTARIWNTRDGSPQTPPLQQADQVYAVCFSADGCRVATGGRDGAVYVWDALTGHPLGPPVQHGSPLRGLQFTPDARQLVSTSLSRFTRVWSRALDDRSREALETQAQFLAGRQIDTTGSLAPLLVSDLPTIWRGLQSKDAK